MDFLYTIGKGYGFLSGFHTFFFTVHNNRTLETIRGCVSLKKYKSQGKAVQVTVNSKEENICLDFVQEYDICTC
jgi:hypothetical protein